MHPDLLDTYCLTAEQQAEIDQRNRERRAAYLKKLRVWRNDHSTEYFERLRRGLAVRWKWHGLWERKDREVRQAAAPVLRLASVHPTFGTGA